MHNQGRCRVLWQPAEAFRVRAQFAEEHAAEQVVVGWGIWQEVGLAGSLHMHFPRIDAKPRAFRQGTLQSKNRCTACLHIQDCDSCESRLGPG